MCPHELPCHAVALVHIAEGVVAAEAVAVHDGFHQTAPKPVKVTGISGRAALDYMISTMRKGNMISDYDVEVLSALARVVTGGDVPKGTLVSERELLDLEAEGNAKLIVTKQALERVRAILTTGKPLRN